MLEGMSKTINVNERPVLDMEHYDFQHTVGNITLTGTWYIDPDTNRSQPCLVLTDATKRLAAYKVVPYITPLNKAWEWTMEFGDPEVIWPKIRELVKEGILPGNPHNDRDLWMIFGAIQTRLRDMMAMPPMPAAPAAKYKAPPETFGELVITDADTGAVLQEAEITINVRR